MSDLSVVALISTVLRWPCLGNKVNACASLFWSCPTRRSAQTRQIVHISPPHRDAKKTGCHNELCPLPRMPCWLKCWPCVSRGRACGRPTLIGQGSCVYPVAALSGCTDAPLVAINAGSAISPTLTSVAKDILLREAPARASWKGNRNAVPRSPPAPHRWKPGLAGVQNRTRERSGDSPNTR